MRSAPPALLALALCAAAARAAPDPAPAPAPAPAGAPETDEARLRRELEEALRADAQGKPGQPAAPASAPAAATSDAPPPRAGARGMQSLNPDISAIVDATAGLLTHPPGWTAGDDPALPARTDGRNGGFTVQELEVALSAVVDPYLKGEVYLTIPNLGGLEVEEAVATTTSLPGNLQVRAGTFRSAFGRQNGQHLHVQDFTLRPLVNAAFLGADGLRGPGAQVSWLAPLPFFLTLYLEGFSLKPPEDGSYASFGAARGGGLTGALHAKAFFPLGEALSLSLGLSAAAGRSAGLALQDSFGNVIRLQDGAATQLFGADLYLKWKPANEAEGYLSLAWQTEAIVRHRGHVDDALVPAVPLGDWDGGLYSQVVARLARRLFLGVRADLLGLPESSAVQRLLRASASLTFQMSEFARLRLEGYADVYGSTVAGPFAPQAAQQAQDALGALLQLEISIGAHGAHAF